MNVRRMPSAPPNEPASKTTLSRGEASPGGCVRRRSLRRPVVLGEDECGEIDLAGELDEPVEGRDTRAEDRRPRVDVGDVLEPRVSACSSFSCWPEDSRLHQSIRVLPRIRWVHWTNVS
jgi:hypothetical protein